MVLRELCKIFVFKIVAKNWLIRVKYESNERKKQRARVMMHKFIKSWLGRYVNSKERAVRKKAKMIWMNLQMKLNAMA